MNERTTDLVHWFIHSFRPFL